MTADCCTCAERVDLQELEHSVQAVVGQRVELEACAFPTAAHGDGLSPPRVLRASSGRHDQRIHACMSGSAPADQSDREDARKGAALGGAQLTLSFCRASRTRVTAHSPSRVPDVGGSSSKRGTRALVT